MRAQEFITESVTDDDAKVFFASCSEYFSHNKNPLNSVMYRGDRGRVRKDNFIKNERNVYQGRTPVDTDEVVHGIVNELFDLKTGFPFRSGMMCAGDRMAAAEYGEPAIIIPCNGYTLCYSPKYADMFKSMPAAIYNELEYTQYDTYEGTPEQAQAIRTMQKILDQFIRNGRYTVGPQHTQAAIDSGNEIMLYPTDFSTLEFYAFSPSVWQTVVTPLILTSLQGERYKGVNEGTKIKWKELQSSEVGDRDEFNKKYRVAGIEETPLGSKTRADGFYLITPGGKKPMVPK